MVAQAQRRCCGQGPREGRVADFFAGRAPAFAGGFFGTLAKATGGDKLLYRRQASNVVHCVEPYATATLPEPGHGLPQRQGVSVMGLGGLDDRQRDVAKPLVVGGDQGSGDCDVLWHGGIGTAFSNPIPVGFVRALLADLGQVVVTLGIVHMRQQCSAFAHQRGTAP
jgi:hypothetical protein